MTDYTTEQRKADAETLRRHVYAAPGAESGVTRDDLRAIADRPDPAPPPMTLREALRSLTGWRTEWPDQVLAVVADPAHRAEVLDLLGEPADAKALIADLHEKIRRRDEEYAALASQPAPQTYDADNPPPVGSLAVWRLPNGLAWPSRFYPVDDWRYTLRAYGIPLAVYPPIGGAS